MKKYSPPAVRPRNLGANGTIVTLDVQHFEWLDELLKEHGKSEILRKVAKKMPKIGAIKIVKDGIEVIIITISRQPAPATYRIDYYSGCDQKSDFSLQMLVSQKEGFKFNDLTPGVTKQDLSEVANFVLGIHVYEYLMKIDSSIKEDFIEPLEVFGAPIF